MNVSERWTLQTEAGVPPSARSSSFVVRVDVYKWMMSIEYVTTYLRSAVSGSELAPPLRVSRLLSLNAELAGHAHHEE